jgi:formylglycine-generating enzyme required for sulfatase activity
MARLNVAWLVIVTLAGCGVRTTVVLPTPTGNPVSKGTEEPKQGPIPEPVPFESIPLSSDSSYTSTPIREGREPGEVIELTNLKLKFCWCPAGRFMMGSPVDSRGHLLNEAPFEATISKGFWLQQTEITQNQFEHLMGSNPSYFKGKDNPVDSVSWTEAVEFCRRLSELPPEKAAGNLFRLPTEAEWEYACRAGSSGEFCFGDNETEMDAYGWYSLNSGRTTHPVGQKKPNSWGLHDVHGNVSEWCLDSYADYPGVPTTDPRGPLPGEKQNLRGGG